MQITESTEPVQFGLTPELKKLQDSGKGLTSEQVAAEQTLAPSYSLSAKFDVDVGSGGERSFAGAVDALLAVEGGAGDVVDAVAGKLDEKLAADMSKRPVERRDFALGVGKSAAARDELYFKDFKTVIAGASLVG